jgi:peptidoglycan/xylan/chitin deacetylase (PgdA/CDA1 family)
VKKCYEINNWETYGLLSNGLLGSLSKRLFKKKRLRTIFAYHGIDSNHSACVSPTVFKEQIEHILKEFKIVKLPDLLSAKHVATDRVASITFDDAYENILKSAIPYLKKVGVHATIFVPTKYLGQKNYWDDENGAHLLNIMTSQQLSVLSGDGISVGSHTHSHFRLVGNDQSILKTEIIDSKHKLEDIIGKKVATFCYPYGMRGDYNPFAIEYIKKAGYELAVSSKYGRTNTEKDKFEMYRITVTPEDDLQNLKLKVSGTYDWLWFKELLAFHIKAKFKK